MRKHLLILPNWMIAFCFTASLWLIHRGLLAQKRRLLWVALAGGCWVGQRWQQVNLFVTLGVSSAAVLALYLTPRQARGA